MENEITVAKSQSCVDTILNDTIPFYLYKMKYLNFSIFVTRAPRFFSR